MGSFPGSDAPVFPEALISILLASRTWLNGWRITSPAANEDGAGSGPGHRLIISRRRIYSDFGVTLPRLAPLFFIKDPRCPGQPWRIEHPGERCVKPGGSQATWAAPAQTRSKDRKTCPWNSCPTSSLALLYKPKQNSSAVSGMLVILARFSSPVYQNQVASGCKW